MHPQRLLLSALAIAAPQLAFAANPTVTIASGVLVGTTIGVSNAAATGSANAFLGVPFASPPKRFYPPTAPAAWTSPKTVQTKPKSCLQSFGNVTMSADAATGRYYFNDLPGGPPGESEDCLYLSVYSPRTAGPNNLKSIMFWLYGGNLATGAASVATYDGSTLAINEDIIVVVPNYRTNIFGFSNSADVPTGQKNSGFLDQRLALQWVQANIANFGGNKDQVTLFGESSGAYSIKEASQLLADPPAILGYRAAILESSGLAAEKNSAANFVKVAQAFCPGATSGTATTCLALKSPTEIQNYINNNSLHFTPAQDTATFAGASVKPQIDAKTFAQVPLMFGSNFMEASVFLVNTDDTTASSPSIPDILTGLIGIDIDSNWSSILGKYPGFKNPTNALLTRVFTDLVFTCPTKFLSEYVATHSSQPVWRYMYEGAFKSIAGGSGRPVLGAYHSSEIASVFGTYPRYGAATADQIALSKYMQHAWATFAKNPSTGPDPAGKWPDFQCTLPGCAAGKLGVLGGSKNPQGLDVEALATVDYACDAYYPILLAAGDVY